MITYISVSEKADEEQLEQLYKVYQQIEELGFDDIWFVIGFSGDQVKAKQFINNYFYYGTEAQSWERFDPTLEEILQIREIGLTFEEFQEQVREAEG